MFFRLERRLSGLVLCGVVQGTGVNKDIVVIAEQGTHSAVFMPGGRARWGQPGGTVQVRATPLPPCASPF